MKCAVCFRRVRTEEAHRYQLGAVRGCLCTECGDALGRALAAWALRRMRDVQRERAAQDEQPPAHASRCHVTSKPELVASFTEEEVVALANLMAAVVSGTDVDVHRLVREPAVRSAHLKSLRMRAKTKGSAS